MRKKPQAVNSEEHMVGLISKHQAALHSYIFALIQDASRADDVLQETNLVLWRKAEEYDVKQPFLPWARSIAWYQVKAAIRDLSRDKLVFSESTLQLLASQAQEVDTYLPTQEQIALSQCIAELTDKQKGLVKARYLEGLSVRKLAEQLNRPAASISQSLHMVRAGLKKCVRLKLVTSSALK